MLNIRSQIWHWSLNQSKKPIQIIIWDKVFKNGASEICGRQPLKNLKWYCLLADHITSNFLRAVFHKFHLLHSWILCHLWISLEFYWQKIRHIPHYKIALFVCDIFCHYRSNHSRMFFTIGVLKTLQISQENTCVGVSIW